MTNQQKQLQSILAEVGINLTENQALAVMEANELLRYGDPSYSQVMEFKEKYAPKRRTITLEQCEMALHKFNHSDKRNNHDSLASHYNENNQPER